jgi:O-glycosyl hydrolase
VLLGACQAAGLAVNGGVEYQTIEGLGGFGAKCEWWSGGPYTDAAFVNLMVTDLGVTMLRTEYEPPGEGGQSFTGKMAPYLQAMRARADQAGEPLRFIATYWSPPSAMKSNGTLNNGGSLLTSQYTQFAQYAVSSVQAFKDIGIDLYALSLQNEPAFVETYNSCVYAPTEYRDMVKAVGPVVHQSFPNVKLFGAEDMLSGWAVRGFPGALMADPLAKAQMGALAVHGYSDGVHPTPASQAATLWRTAARNCTSAGKPLWMTETSGFEDTWTDALALGEAMYAALKYGKLAAWVYWQLSICSDQVNEGLMQNGVPTKRYYVSKNYMRYIRPGAVMVDIVDTLEPNVFATAYNDKQAHRLVVVVLNVGTGSANTSLSGAGIPAQVRKHTTSATKDCSDEGLVASSAVTLDASSVTTFVGEGYAPVGVALTQPRGADQLQRNAAAVGVYSLDGRQVRPRQNTPTSSAGVFLVAAEARQGCRLVVRF